MSIISISSAMTRDHHPKRGWIALLSAFGALSLFGASGCVGEVQTEAVVATPAVVTYEAPVAYQEPVVYEEPVTYVTTVPVDIQSRPRVYYQGTYVYYVDGRWYYPSPRGWAYYRSEPTALIRYRVDFERRRPQPVYHERVYVQSRPYVRYPARPRYVARTTR